VNHGEGDGCFRWAAAEPSVARMTVLLWLSADAAAASCLLVSGRRGRFDSVRRRPQRRPALVFPADAAEPSVSPSGAAAPSFVCIPSAAAEPSVGCMTLLLILSADAAAPSSLCVSSGRGGSVRLRRPVRRRPPMHQLMVETASTEDTILCRMLSSAVPRLFKLPKACHFLYDG